MGEPEFVRSARSSPGPRDWILDIFGSFVRDSGGRISVAALVSLLESLGVGSASARSALSRMKSQGELQAVAQDGARGYSLTDSAERWFAVSTPRIMNTAPPAEDDQWIFATFTVPESERALRYRIRSRLKALGFGSLAGGLMIAPAAIIDETANALGQAGLDSHVDLWQSEYRGFGSVDDIVARAWDLEEVADAYAHYLDLCSDLDSRPSPTDDEDAFLRFLIHVNAWRDLPYLDPGIPLKYLPDDWPSERARETFARISAELRPGALRHFLTVTTPAEGLTLISPIEEQEGRSGATDVQNPG